MTENARGGFSISLKIAHIVGPDDALNGLTEIESLLSMS